MRNRESGRGTHCCLPVGVDRARRRLVALFGLLVLAAASSGCGRWFKRPSSSFAGEMPSASELVAAINRNADKVQTLYVKDLGISVQSLPLNGWLALEKPRRFRLIAKNPFGGKEGDLGSNDEEFWCFVRRGVEGPSLVHCSYEDYGRTRVSLPFQPDWILDSVGLSALDAGPDTIVQPGKRGTAEIITPTVTPQGQAATKTTVVQLNTRWIVERHLDLTGPPKRRVASAYLSGHRTDSAFGAVYPGSVRIEWPDAAMKLSIQLDDVQVNPGFSPATAQNLWRIPSEEIEAGAQDLDLGAGGATIRSRHPPAARVGPGIRNVESDTRRATP